ncbi:glycosyltransferase family 4 protein [Geomonas oryzisoli]|uniref:Glycosyltransferase family 4 protein n=1 Tax=Geomonas oryzisoli TaxID=2847992 RepID=A0ABX8JEK7_9BACT|nr:glycosyltransferase family 1 protein [Geomonas oryzisoli]QWV95079.1 glycosyltransferase family 4 protein [Geomonas oryzisoli]
MRRIGLFLDVEPHLGGTFQYNQAVLHALAALPSAHFQVVVGYTSELWREYLGELPVESFRVRSGIIGRGVGYLWHRLDLPLGPWRAVNPLFHPMARDLLGKKCDLWIFPSQDTRGCEFPVPALIAIHDLMHRYESRFPEVGTPREFRIREKQYASICRWARGVLVDSRIGAAQVRESYGLQEERIHVLPFIAPPHAWNDSPPPGFDERYHLPEKFVFYPAQFWEHKNHARLVHAIARLKGDFPDLKLVLVGSLKNAYDGLVALIGELGLKDAVQFLGYVPDEDMPELYRRARALVMPTFFGPTNIPPLEAFAAGCPVAISDRYGMPEQAGDAALFFDPESVEAIAETVRRLWTDDALCAELVRRGTERAASWGQVQFGQRLQEIIETIT